MSTGGKDLKIFYNEPMKTLGKLVKISFLTTGLVMMRTSLC